MSERWHEEDSRVIAKLGSPAVSSVRLTSSNLWLIIENNLMSLTMYIVVRKDLIKVNNMRVIIIGILETYRI